MFVKIVQAIVLILGLTLLGAALGLITPFVVSASFGPSDAWADLPTPPQPAVRIVAGDYRVVYIEDADGQVYRCAMASKGACWEPWSGSITPGVDVQAPDRWPCPTDMHDDPPGDKTADLYFEECVPGMMMTSDAAAFRVLPDGRVEAWVSGGDGSSRLAAGFAAQCLFPLGAVIGLAVGVILVVRLNRSKAVKPVPLS